MPTVDSNSKNKSNGAVSPINTLNLSHEHNDAVSESTPPERDDSNSNHNLDLEADVHIEEMVSVPLCCSLKRTISIILKLTVLIVLLGVTGILMYIFNTNHPIAQEIVMFIIKNKVAAPFILIAFNIVITLFFLPGVFGALLCGYSYCFLYKNIALVLFSGTLTCFVGFSIGSVIAMLIGKFLARNCIRNLHEKNKYLKALTACFETKGLRILILLRLSPLVPYNVLNYLVGAYPVKLWQF